MAWKNLPNHKLNIHVSKWRSQTKNLENLPRSCCFILRLSSFETSSWNLLHQSLLPPNKPTSFSRSTQDICPALSGKSGMSTSLKTQLPKKWRTHKNCRNVIGFNAWVSSKSWGRNFHLLQKKKNTPKNEDETPTSEALKWRDLSEFPLFLWVPMCFSHAISREFVGSDFSSSQAWDLSYRPRFRPHGRPYVCRSSLKLRHGESFNNTAVVTGEGWVNKGAKNSECEAKKRTRRFFWGAR